MPKNIKYWKNRFGDLDTNAYHQRFDLRRIPDLDDVAFAYMLTHVRGINMLDLNETEITNASIHLLTTLEYVDELGLQGCENIDDDCIADLNKITSLQLLYVKDTGITIDGLLQLNGLTKLRKLLFSAADVVAIKDKIQLLHTMLIHCSFVINSIPYKIED